MMNRNVDFKTIAEVKAQKPTKIYYSVNTVFWTHDPNDLDTNSAAIPLDCFGSPLFETSDQSKVDQFLNADAIKAHPSYGKPENRERNFMLSHASNIKRVCSKMPSRSFDLVRDYTTFCKFCDENIGA